MRIKTLFSGIAITTGLLSCSSNQNSSLDTGDDDKKNQNTHLCFLRLEGLQNQDSSIISLHLNGSQVSGTFNHLPFEKDSRKGTITGELKGDTIKALWSFMQEGMNDTIRVEFKLSENKLLQKSFGVDQSTGRQILTDTSTFSIPYQKTVCESNKTSTAAL